MSYQVPLPDWIEQQADACDPLTILMAREGSLTELDVAEMHAAFYARAEQIVTAHNAAYPNEEQEDADYY